MFCLWSLQTALWHLRLSSQKKKKRRKSISVPGVVCVLMYHCYGGAKDLFPQLMKAQSEMLPLSFSWQVQISLIDIKAVMITLPRTRWRTTLGSSRSCCDCLTRALNLWRAGTVVSRLLYSNLLFISFRTHWHGSRSTRWFQFHELLTLNQFTTDAKRLCWFRSCMCVLLILQIFHLQNKMEKSSIIDFFLLYFSIFLLSCNLQADWFPLFCNHVLVLWLIGLLLRRCCSTTFRF